MNKEKRRKIIDLSSGYIGNIVIEDVNHLLQVDIEVNTNYIIGCISSMKHLFTQLCELYKVHESNIDALLSVSKVKYIELNVIGICEGRDSRRWYLHSITQVP